MKKIIVFITVLVFVECKEFSVKNFETRIAFEDFKLKNNFTYNSNHNEYQAYLNFKETYNFVNECNSEFQNGNSTYKCEINKFANESEEFFSDIFNDFLEDDVVMRADDDYPEVPECNLTFLNYSAMGYPSFIRNQGRCGACYAFAATSVCEAAYFKKTNRLYKFSEQQLVDCTQTEEFNNFGCRGGRISSGLKYLQAYGAINDSDYQPYSQRDNNTCIYDERKVITKIKSFSRLLRVEENYLKNLLCAIGPVTVAIDGSLRGFQFYSSGIFNDKNCRNSINHAMLLVGFGTDPEFGPYWILKNSYGKRWGEYGYMRLARGLGNLCGILEQVFICNI